MLELIGARDIHHMAKVTIIPDPRLPAKPTSKSKLALVHAGDDAVGWTIEIGGIPVDSGKGLGKGLRKQVADKVAGIR